MQQVRFKSAEYFASERVRSNSREAMLTKDEAIAIGITTALRPGGTKAPRVSSGASYCVSYKLDEDGNRINAKVFSPSNRKPNRRKLNEADKVEIAEKLAAGHHITAADLAPIFAD